MKKYVQAFLRHKLLLIAPIVLALVVSLGMTLRQPKEWVSGATLWADSAVPNESTILSKPDPTPASQATSVLQELLHTRSFLAKVAANESSAAFLKGAKAPFDDITLGKVAGSLTLATPGPQVVSVAVTAHDPAAASGLATAFVQEFRTEVAATLQARNRELVDFQQQRLDGAAKALDAAHNQLSTYLADHPQNTDAAQDPTVTQLEGSLVAAQDQYSAAQDDYNAAQLSLSAATSSSSLRIVDEANVPTFPQSRRTAIMFGGVGGMIAGGLVSLLLLLFFVSTDSTARQPADIEQGLGLRVVGSIEQLRGGRRLTRRAS